MACTCERGWPATREYVATARALAGRNAAASNWRCASNSARLIWPSPLVSSAFHNRSSRDCIECVPRSHAFGFEAFCCESVPAADSLGFIEPATAGNATATTGMNRLARSRGLKVHFLIVVLLAKNEVQDDFPDSPLRCKHQATQSLRGSSGYRVPRFTPHVNLPNATDAFTIASGDQRQRFSRSRSRARTSQSRVSTAAGRRGPNR